MFKIRIGIEKMKKIDVLLYTNTSIYTYSYNCTIKSNILYLLCNIPEKVVFILAGPWGVGGPLKGVCFCVCVCVCES